MDNVNAKALIGSIQVKLDALKAIVDGVEAPVEKEEEPEKDE